MLLRNLRANSKIGVVSILLRFSVSNSPSTKRRRRNEFFLYMKSACFFFILL